MPSAPTEPTLTGLVSDKQLGDISLLEPMTRLLAHKSGQPVALFVKDAFRPLVDLMPHATWGPASSLPLDELWATSWGSKTALKAWRMRAKKKILLHNRLEHRRWWYRWIYDDIRREPHGLEYWGLYFWRMAGGEPRDFVSSRLKAPPPDWRHPDLPPAPYIALVPTSAWPEKLWQVEAWCDFIRQIPVAGPLVMLGGSQPFEKAHCAQIAASQSAPTNLCGQTSLRQYLHALANARAVISVDGSAAHLAQAFERPAVTIFGPTQVERWHYPGPHHQAVTAKSFNPDHKPGPAHLVPVQAVRQSLQNVLNLPLHESA